MSLTVARRFFPKLFPKKNIPRSSGVHTPPQHKEFTAPESGLTEFQYVPYHELPEGSRTDLSVTDSISASVRSRKNRRTWLDDTPGYTNRPKPSRPTPVVPYPEPPKTKPRPPSFAVWPHLTRQATVGLHLSESVRVDRDRPKLKPPIVPEDRKNCQAFEHALGRERARDLGLSCGRTTNIRISGSTAKKSTVPSFREISRIRKKIKARRASLRNG